MINHNNNEFYMNIDREFEGANNLWKVKVELYSRQHAQVKINQVLKNSDKTICFRLVKHDFNKVVENLYRLYQPNNDNSRHESFCKELAYDLPLTKLEQYVSSALEFITTTQGVGI